MRHHNIWGSAYGAGAGLSGILVPVGPGLCRILQMNFREFLFHALR
jgi:hypothetical protein